MQPTDLQVERSLEALRRSSSAGPRPLSAPPGAAPAGPVELDDMPDGVIEWIDSIPPVRADRLAEAQARLALGDQPDADSLARRMVGRLVCDRLR